MENIIHECLFKKKILVLFCFVIHNVAIFSYVEYIYLLKIIKCGKKGHFQFWFHGYKTGIVCCFFFFLFLFLCNAKKHMFLYVICDNKKIFKVTLYRNLYWYLIPDARRNQHNNLSVYQ